MERGGGGGVCFTRLTEIEFVKPSLCCLKASDCQIHPDLALFLCLSLFLEHKYTHTHTFSSCQSIAVSLHLSLLYPYPSLFFSLTPTLCPSPFSPCLSSYFLLFPSHNYLYLPCSISPFSFASKKANQQLYPAG